MLAAQGVEIAGLRFSGAEKVIIVGANGGAPSAANHQPGNPVPPGKMNRHAAILAGATFEPAAMRLDEARAKELRDRLTSILADYVNVKTSQAKPWRIDCDVTDRELARLALAASAPVCTGGSAPWTGRQRFLLSFSSADGPVQLTIFAEVSPPPMPAVIAVRPIARGDVIKAADVELRTVDANTQGGQRVPVAAVEKLIGMEARQAIQDGDVVFMDQVRAPILVKRGDVIAVSSQGGGIRVRTSARALQDGANGDLVQVESLGSREKYDVRIVGPREAAVFSVIRR
jgi:flagella basal body P-ring formation protein FlgA